MKIHHVSTLVLTAVFVTATLVPAQVSAPPGISVSSIDVGTTVTGLAFGPGGAYGTDLYASGDGVVLRIDVETGVVSTFATGLATAGSAPSGLAFDVGTFGTGLLYVVQNGSTVVTVAPDGSAELFSQAGALYSCNDLMFAPPASLYGPGLVVANGISGSGHVSVVAADGSNVLLSDPSNFSSSPMGLDLAPPGSAFGDMLHTTLFGTGELLTVAPDGTATLLASGLGWAIDMVFGRAAPFGDWAYVSDPSLQSILRVAADGSVETWATGLAFTASGFDGDLLFDPSGRALYAAEGTAITVFQSCTDNPAADLGYGKLGSNGLVPNFSLCGGLASGETAIATLAFAPPSSLAMLMFSLAPNPVPGFGGTVVTIPILVSVIVSTDATGTIVFPIPGGNGPVDLTAQWLVRDVGLPGGVGISNGVTLSIEP